MGYQLRQNRSRSHTSLLVRFQCRHLQPWPMEQSCLLNGRELHRLLRLHDRLPRQGGTTVAATAIHGAIAPPAAAPQTLPQAQTVPAVAVGKRENEVGNEPTSAVAAPPRKKGKIAVKLAQ